MMIVVLSSGSIDWNHYAKSALILWENYEHHLEIENHVLLA